MYCSHCHMPCSEQDQFCASCGNALRPAENKGRHWVPLLIMAVLALCCTALFFAIPMKEAEPAVTLTSQEMPWFSLQEHVLYFDESKYTGGSQLSVPGSIEGQSVTAISEECFADCSALTAIYLPDTLEAIGEDAFRNCTALRGMEIPSPVAFVGKGAFSGCTALEAVCLSNNLQHIGSGAFDGCTGLRYVYFLGTFQEWKALSSDFSDPNVVISCEDGKFYQGGESN